MNKYNNEIEAAAKEFMIPVDALKAILFLENSHGYYDIMAPTALKKSLRPMNIYAMVWKNLGITKEQLEDPVVNIRAGAFILSELWRRTVDSTFAKVASLYNFAGAEMVSDYGARAERLRQLKPWTEGFWSSLFKSWFGIPADLLRAVFGSKKEKNKVTRVITKINDLTYEIARRRDSAIDMQNQALEAAANASANSDRAAREAAKIAAEAVRRNDEELRRLTRELDFAKRDLTMLTVNHLRRLETLELQNERLREMNRANEREAMRRNADLEAARALRESLELSRKRAEEALRFEQPKHGYTFEPGPPTITYHPPGWRPNW